MEKRTLKWRARRGTRELDLVLECFLDHGYASLSDDLKRRFSELLEEHDPSLQKWILWKSEEPPVHYVNVIEAIDRTWKIQHPSV